MKTSIYQLKWGTFNLIEGDFISQYAALYGEWSDVEVQFFLENLNSSSNVIEVGSNIGMHAVPIAKKISGGGVNYFVLNLKGLFFRHFVQICRLIN
ncbi:hypothetical protein B0185_09710 [Haemophilus parahaemolyticus]|uniref:Uncharacterized protein n=1 Tax=Haemophilus parahaemolyticus HK385 TaxID=1095744 RepID=A0ABP2P0W1_HAEPH|nr:hypothetical protein [Haemophilus parahaemolyticus]EIJ67542.1 hypothetical protein HMPREF1050_2012 [Haemophilus parahaemolyticus HK385]OOR94496.1 hypothetical protein B0185_09710 [Haemophilus parahaemolyticus]QRP12274.1 hypothetical protein I6J29_08375 [Haemophilus parahaemolyticus]